MSVMDSLQERLNASDEMTRCLAIEELSVLAERGQKQAIEKLIDLLNSPSMVEGETAVLGLIGTRSAMLVEVLLEHLNSDHALFRNRVADVLKAIGGKNLHAIINYYQHPSQRSRIFILEILAAVGKGHTDEKKVVDFLCKLILQTEIEGNAKAVAIESLGKIGNKKTIEVLNQLFYKSQTVHQFAIIGALARIGNEEAKHALRDIERFIDSSSSSEVSTSSMLKSFVVQILGVK